MDNYITIRMFILVTHGGSLVADIKNIICKKASFMLRKYTAFYLRPEVTIAFPLYYPAIVVNNHGDMLVTQC